MFLLPASGWQQGNWISGFKLGLFDENILLHLPGGDLRFTVYEKEDALGAFMEGPAELVFDGEF